MMRVFIEIYGVPTMEWAFSAVPRVGDIVETEHSVFTVERVVWRLPSGEPTLEVKKVVPKGPTP